MTPTEVQDRLKLKDLKDKIWYVVPSCATTGEGLFDGLVRIHPKWRPDLRLTWPRAGYRTISKRHLNEQPNKLLRVLMNGHSSDDPHVQCPFFRSLGGYSRPCQHICFHQDTPNLSPLIGSATTRYVIVFCNCMVGLFVLITSLVKKAN